MKHIKWRGFIKKMRQKAELALNVLKLDNVILSIYLTDNVEIKRLNKQYRQKDQETNVLAIEMRQSFRDKKIIGDVILSYEYILLESKNLNRKFIKHCTHMLIHGILHLLGYDHERKDQEIEMKNLEKFVLLKIGSGNPYGDI